MIPAGEAAMGFICATWWGTGTHFPLIQDILTYVYARGKGPGPEEDVGTTRWKLGVLEAVLATEALRTAMREFGHQPLTGAQAIVSGTNFAQDRERSGHAIDLCRNVHILMIRRPAWLLPPPPR
jgi:hypothetical protein